MFDGYSKFAILLIGNFDNTHRKGCLVAEHSFKKIKNVRLSDQAMEQIQEMIFSGKFSPGEKLPSESQLIKSLDVSRSSVREALRALESKGVIEVRPGLGAYVQEQPFSFQSVDQAIEWLLNKKESLVQVLLVREVLEGLAASLLAAKKTNTTIFELEEIIEQQKSMATNDRNIEDFSDLALRFHLLIAGSVENPLLESLIGSIISQIYTGNRAVLHVCGRVEKSLADHQRIIDVLKSGDTDLAEKVMREHVASLRLQIMKMA